MNQGLFPYVLRRFVPCVLAAANIGSAAELPKRFYELMQRGVAEVEERFTEEVAPLAADENRPVWMQQVPNTLLAVATLHAQAHPDNPRRGDPKLLALAKRMGDLLAADSAKLRSFDPNAGNRGLHHREIYVWLESFRVLEKELEPARRANWRRELERQLEAVSVLVKARADAPAFVSTYLNTSTNHFALWLSTLYVGAKVLGRLDWLELTSPMMHRLCAEEQSPDGFWGEHDRNGPTPGYNLLTTSAVALYWEYSRDPAALEALRRATEFHRYFTYPNGRPIEVLNERARYDSMRPWGYFGFSNFPEGRGYAEFLTSHLDEERSSRDGETLGRIAQNALYWREGPSVPALQLQSRYWRRLSEGPAGIRKTGPWVVTLSGIISTPSTSRFYMDRQSHLSVFHERLGHIITGAQSKGQPELATLREVIRGKVHHTPVIARLHMSDWRDQLALGFHAHVLTLTVDPPTGDGLRFRYRATLKHTVEDEASLNLQLMLAAGERLETATGRVVTLGEEKLSWGPAELGGWIRHQGWTLRLDPGARLMWPVYPYNPYAAVPETSLGRAIGVISVPVKIDRKGGMEPMGSKFQETSFLLQDN